MRSSPHKTNITGDIRDPGESTQVESPPNLLPSTQQRKPQEASFTLTETLIALAILASIIVPVMGVQGNAAAFGDYYYHATKASWLGQAILSEVEHSSHLYPIKEIKASGREEEFSPTLCPKTDPYQCPFLYKLTIEEFKLPLITLITGGLAGGGGEDDDSEEGSGDPFVEMIEGQIKEILGDILLKTATVEVSWPEGAKRMSVKQTLMLTADRGIHEYVETLSPPSVCPFGQKMKNGDCVPKDAKDAKNVSRKKPSSPNLGGGPNR